VEPESYNDDKSISSNMSLDQSELSLLDSALARNVEQRLESNKSAVLTAIQMRKNLNNG